MLGNTGIYAVKKRKKPAQKPKKLPGSDGTKSNPSKRHRDRLNGELDRLTGLLPFPEDVRSRLDKLSVLRLSVGYLKVKSFFKATMNKSSVTFPGGNGLSMVGNGMDPKIISEGDLLLQALNGFVLVVSAEGYVFYSSPTIQDYLGFHQSDVIHQSVFELIHTDDRAMFRRQLHFALNPRSFSTEQGGDGMQSSSDITMNIVSYNPEQLPPENSSFLERSFICRFRCLLDNSSGFLALNFQGRLKYLHGQSIMGEDGTKTQSQLALFTIATPVQTPSILEIRSKTLIFQTKHKLDFTPTGIDTRGKVILGYTEIELCMRGSGYQFVHAADMMYCADSHLKMMKTGETGHTVFRLLTKTGAWVWVNSNAKLTYKGGRPDFIIARQRALVNAEGEEHLSQRKLHLPFSFATGEAFLYDTGPMLDANDFQTNGMTPRIPKIEDHKEVDPQSLLGSLLRQDQSVYAQPAEVQLPEDMVFLDSRALVNVPSNHWQVLGSPAEGPSGVKQEEKADDDSVEAMINALENMAQASDLCAALQELDVDSGEMKDWETALLKLSQGGLNGDSTLELNDILTNDIFSYVEDALFKESGISVSQPSCQGTMNNNDCGEMFTNVLSPDAGPCKTHLLQNHDFDNTQSPPLDSLHAQSPNSEPMGMVGQGPNPFFGSTQRLSHFGPKIQELDLNIPTLQQLQLNDIFTPSVELPGLNLPATSDQNDSVTFDHGMVESCVQPPCTQSMAGQHPCSNMSHKHYPPNGMQAQIMVNRQPQNSVGQSSSHVAHSLPSSIPCYGFPSPHIEPSDLNVPGAFPMACMQGSSPFQRTQTNHRGQHWPQSQQQKLPPNGILQNGNKLLPDCHSQPPDTQKVLTDGLWPQNINGLYHTQQGGLGRDLSAPSSSCMFESFSSSLPNNSHVDGTGQVSLLSQCRQRMDTPQDQSPSAGSCYFQWGHSDPVVGISAIPQENTSISPLAMQLVCQGQKQIPSHPADSNGLFSVPPAIDGKKFFTDQNQTNCCNF